MTDEKTLSKMKIAIVDDHDLVREGLNVVLANNGAVNVDKFSNAMELVSALGNHPKQVVWVGMKKISRGLFVRFFVVVW